MRQRRAVTGRQHSMKQRRNAYHGLQYCPAPCHREHSEVTRSRVYDLMDCWAARAKAAAQAHRALPASLRFIVP